MHASEAPKEHTAASFCTPSLGESPARSEIIPRGLGRVSEHLDSPSISPDEGVKPRAALSAGLNTLARPLSAPARLRPHPVRSFSLFDGEGTGENSSFAVPWRCRMRIFAIVPPSNEVLLTEAEVLTERDTESDLCPPDQRDM